MKVASLRILLLLSEMALGESSGLCEAQALFLRRRDLMFIFQGTDVPYQ